MRKLLLLGIILVIPIIIFFANFGISYKFKKDWNKNLEEVALEWAKEDGVDTAAILLANAKTRFSLDSVCADKKIQNELKVGESCTYYNLSQMFQKVSLGMIALGIFSFITISLFGLIGRIHRSLLLFVFRIGIYGSLILGAIMLTINGLMLIPTIYVGESLLIQRVHIGILAGLGLAIVVGLISVLKPAKNILEPIKTGVFGKSLPEADYPRIWTFVKDAAQKLGSKMPEQIIVGLGEEIFVTEAEVTCLDGSFKGRTMFISLPMMRQLEMDQLLSVLGHEMGHFRGSDTLFSKRFYPIYRGAQEALGYLSESSESAGSIILLPVSALLMHFLEVFSKIESRFGRERELIADEAGAEITSKETMGQALTKVYAYSGLWVAIQKIIIGLLSEDKCLKNASKFYYEELHEIDKNQLIKNINTSSIEHPTDTHPSLSVRLKNLGFSEERFYDQVLSQPGLPAIDLIPDVENLEEELSQIESERFIRMGYGKKSDATVAETETA